VYRGGGKEKGEVMRGVTRFHYLEKNGLERILTKEKKKGKKTMKKRVPASEEPP